jgi:hypothetical protein
MMVRKNEEIIYSCEYLKRGNTTAATTVIGKKRFGSSIGQLERYTEILITLVVFLMLT